MAVAEGCATGAFPADWDAGVVVGFFAGVFEELAVAVADGCVVSPSSDAVGLGPACEWDKSRTATTAMMTAAAAVVIGHRHRRQPDVRRDGGAGGPPGTVGLAALNGADTGTTDVSGNSEPRPPSTRVAETESAAPDAGMTGSSVVGS